MWRDSGKRSDDYWSSKGGHLLPFAFRASNYLCSSSVASVFYLLKVTNMFIFCIGKVKTIGSLIITLTRSGVTESGKASCDAYACCTSCITSY